MIHPPIEDLLKTTDAWFRNDDGSVGARSTKHGETNYYVVARETLTAYHYLLPTVMDACMVEADWVDRVHALNNRVKATMAVLTGRTVCAKDSAGHFYVLTNPTQIDMEKPAAKYVYVNASVAVFDEVTGVGPTLPIVRTTKSFGHTVSKASLNEYYPHWEERYHVGMTLDIKNIELLRYMFTRATTAQPNMTDLTFDDYA